MSLPVLSQYTTADVELVKFLLSNPVKPCEQERNGAIVLVRIQAGDCLALLRSWPCVKGCTDK